MLTFVEEQLISLVHVHQYVYMRGFGEASSKAHCINFSQNISSIVHKLPRLPTDLPIVIINKKESDGTVHEFRVRRNVVLLWLEYLKKNSQVPGYRDMAICYDRINQLPADDALPGLTTIETEHKSDLINCPNGPDLTEIIRNESEQTHNDG